MKKYLVLFICILFFGCKKEKSDIVPFEKISLNERDKIVVFNYEGNLNFSIPIELNNDELILKKYSELLIIVKDKWKISSINIDVLNGLMNDNFVNKIKAVNKGLFFSNGLTYKHDSDAVFIKFTNPSLPKTDGEDNTDK
jgi:hypothetical protein